jgi:uncharacterized cysteine cluster protein YcgN (CxxCxxCC family)
LGEEAKPFWEVKGLEEMSPEEWDLLCDGCGRCCLIKLEDEDTDEVYTTRLACSLLDVKSCRCRDYANRHKVMHDCLTISPESLKSLDWLPSSCGYVRMADGRGLAWWHPLVSGNPDTVHQAGISVRSFARSERGIKNTSFHRYIIQDLGE